MSASHDVGVVAQVQVEAVTDDESKKSSAVILPAIAEFSEQLEKICETIKVLKEKVDAAEPGSAGPPKSLWEKLCNNSLMDVFIGDDVTNEDVDSIVNTITLMNALVLTIPYGIMSSAGYDYWDWVQDTLKQCPSTKFTFDQDFNQFGRAFHAVIYSAITILLVAMAYYLLRPRTVMKFRRWWKAGARYVIFIMLAGTTSSCISMVACTTWMFSWYMMPTSKLCTYSAWASGGAIFGVAFILVTFFISLFLML